MARRKLEEGPVCFYSRVSEMFYMKKSSRVSEGLAVREYTLQFNTSYTKSSLTFR